MGVTFLRKDLLRLVRGRHSGNLHLKRRTNSERGIKDVQKRLLFREFQEETNCMHLKKGLLHEGIGEKESCGTRGILIKILDMENSDKLYST